MESIRRISLHRMWSIGPLQGRGHIFSSCPHGLPWQSLFIYMLYQKEGCGTSFRCLMDSCYRISFVKFVSEEKQRQGSPRLGNSPLRLRLGAVLCPHCVSAPMCQCVTESVPYTEGTLLVRLEVHELNNLRGKIFLALVES